MSYGNSEDQGKILSEVQGYSDGSALHDGLYRKHDIKSGDGTDTESDVLRDGRRQSDKVGGECSGREQCIERRNTMSQTDAGITVYGRQVVLNELRHASAALTEANNLARRAKEKMAYLEKVAQCPHEPDDLEILGGIDKVETRCRICGYSWFD